MEGQEDRDREEDEFEIIERGGVRPSGSKTNSEVDATKLLLFCSVKGALPPQYTLIATA